MKANEIKKGSVLQIDNQPIMIKQVQVQSPSSRSGSTLYKVKGKNIITRQKFERSFKGDEQVETVEFVRRPVQLLYQDSDGCTFMDSETYEQFIVSKNLIEEELTYVSEGLEGMQAFISNEQVLGIELPGTVTLEIVDSAPGIKGASASARSKPATLSTGLVVQVPEYLNPGERIKINTDNGAYISRG
ncbi:elongation factor P-like protein EfpL [Candidatus Venteria ishoeyi]|uniref:Elongation factor P-like protein n=1 Tax=Candidatus Venteria ishoeyi TaxID=1899563 RepID=A0A1H6FCG4_9GAMM|nr:elongation factor P-like protein YeiP [Candidatus Venteria ishoeyi]SEH07323.1 Elongation factor P-like protein [Candidatus Venteria ishoeyi]